VDEQALVPAASADPVSRWWCRQTWCGVGGVGGLLPWPLRGALHHGICVPRATTTGVLYDRGLVRAGSGRLVRSGAGAAGAPWRACAWADAASYCAMLTPTHVL